MYSFWVVKTGFKSPTIEEIGVVPIPHWQTDSQQQL